MSVLKIDQMVVYDHPNLLPTTIQQDILICETIFTYIQVAICLIEFGGVLSRV